jgi:hypothetical protein
VSEINEKKEEVGEIIMNGWIEIVVRSALMKMTDNMCSRKEGGSCPWRVRGAAEPQVFCV